MQEEVHDEKLVLVENTVDFSVDPETREEFNRMRDAYLPAIEQFRNHEIPEEAPDTTRITAPNHHRWLLQEHWLDDGSISARGKVISLCGYCFLSYSWIRPLAEWIGRKRCLEIMCGSGAFSYALKTCGVDVIATDTCKYKDTGIVWTEAPWTHIEKIDCIEAIQKYGAQRDLIICSWPYPNDTCYEALLEMRRINPSLQMLYIGDPEVTASEKFYDAAIDVVDVEFQKAVQNYRAFFSFHDFPRLLR